jgi:phage shock protein C
MEIEMQDAQLTVETQDNTPGPDSLFGVCHALGNDLGFNPFYLRVALLGLLFVSPVAVFASYIGMGAAVALSHWLFPKPVAAEAMVSQACEDCEPELLAA